MAVHKRAETRSPFGRLAEESSPARRKGKRWPFGKLLLVVTASTAWIGLIALVKALI